MPVFAVQLLAGFQCISLLSASSMYGRVTAALPCIPWADTMSQSAALSTSPAGRCRARTLMKAPGCIAAAHIGKQLKPSATQLELVNHTHSSKRVAK